MHCSGSALTQMVSWHDKDIHTHLVLKPCSTSVLQHIRGSVLRPTANSHAHYSPSYMPSCQKITLGQPRHTPFYIRLKP
jgi:hypothetical protein